MGTEAGRQIVEQFKSEAARAGAAVYEAKSAQDACSYLVNLARERGVQQVVKSRSALAEAVGLRKHLEEEGVVVTETVLGEWIGQLAQEAQGRRESVGEPRNIEQMADLIGDAVGRKVEADPRAVSVAARAMLRRACINADMGISEAAVGIAGMGSVVMASDEGGDRLVAVLPRLHVTLVGSEMIVRGLDEATAVLKGLEKAAGDSALPRYITYITGRNTTADIPGALLARAQGPEEEHIVIVDGTANQ